MCSVEVGDVCVVIKSPVVPEGLLNLNRVLNCNKNCSGAHTHTPVSYTHLDVYKRQT